MAGDTTRRAPDDTKTPPPSAYERTDALLVRQPVRSGGGDAVRELVAAARPEDATDARWLLDADDVATVTLFYAPGAGAPALCWYVEVTTTRWLGRETALLERSPLFDDGLGDHLEARTEPTADAGEPVVHVRNPHRPGTSDDPDVVLVGLGVRSGVPALVARGLAAAVDLLDGTRLHRRLVASSGEVIEDERMWTETLWLEREDGDYAVRWYMEADDMAHVNDAYEASDNPVARWSNVVLSRVFEQPVETLGDPVAASDWTVLAHATNPENR